MRRSVHLVGLSHV